MLLPMSLVHPILSGMMAFALQASSPVAAPNGSPHSLGASPRPTTVAQTGISAPENKRTDDEIHSTQDQPRVTVAIPVPADGHANWTIPERIRWVTELGLVLLGYAGVMLALSALRKVERQKELMEALASAANDAAQAALLHGQAMVRSERPWLMMTVEPSPGVENGSTVVATNRGKSPARVVASIARVVTARDEHYLPPVPEYARDGGASESARILFPGESTAIMTFSREDVEQSCTADELDQVRNWDLKVFVYGKVTYEDFISPGHESHKTSWCCWYIYGERKSGLITMDVPSYNVKT